MFRCTSCGRDINSFSAPDSCPHCGVRFSGVRCEGCGYTGTKYDFIGSHCPKCNNRVYIPNYGQSTSRPMTKNEKIWASIFVGSLSLVLLGLFLYNYVYIPHKELKNKNEIKHQLEINSGTFTDTRDGNIYKTIKIGHQTVMAENFKFKPSKGVYLTKASRKYTYIGYLDIVLIDTVGADDHLYKDKVGNGYLYTWETACKIAPKGWHLPSKKEFETIMSYFGNDKTVISDKLSVDGTIGFNGIGFNSASSPTYWTSTKFDTTESWYFNFESENDLLSRCNKKFVSSVRLFKD
jgi:uncharacterized protein (TIGR02145 family)